MKKTTFGKREDVPAQMTGAHWTEYHLVASPDTALAFLARRTDDLLQALQAQRQENEALRARIEALERRVKSK